MSEPAKKPGRAPESYDPKDVPEIVRMAAAQGGASIISYTNPAPHTFDTERLMIRRFRPGDWRDLQEIGVSNNASEFADFDHPWAADAKGAKKSCKWCTGNDHCWAVEVKSLSKVVCFVNFNGMNEAREMDIGHVMNETYSGDDYEYEALAVLYDHCFRQDQPTAIIAGWMMGDKKKLAPLAKLGMELISTGMGKAFRGDRTAESCRAVVTKEDWEQNNPTSYDPKDMPEIVRMAENFEIPPQKKGRKARVIEIQNVHSEHLPPLKLIGKRYTNADRKKGGYSAYWKEWHRNNWFAPLEALPKVPGVETGYIGFMRCTSDFKESFEYWIGTMDLPDSPVPEGYESIDLPAVPVAVCWLHGREKDGLYGQHDNCVKAVEELGEVYTDPQGYHYFFERYNCERFGTPDDDGRVILDYGIYIREGDAQ